MKKILLIIIAFLLVFSCGSCKTATYSKPKTSSVSNTSYSLRNLTSTFDGKNTNSINKILENAEEFLGSPYKSGGTSKAGFDCSGLVITVYNENKIKLPRRSADQALQGKKIEISETKPGDLLFFATNGNSNVSHVGIVKEIKYKGEITFIHSSTSKGVIVSSLNEKYWNKAFLFARRVL